MIAVKYDIVKKIEDGTRKKKDRKKEREYWSRSQCSRKGTK
jgi:hypothetical protein